jgi:hypothetical protein
VITLTEKLKNLRYELLMAYMDRDMCNASRIENLRKMFSIFFIMVGESSSSCMRKIMSKILEKYFTNVRILCLFLML